MLTKPHDAGLGLTVWNAYHVNNMRQVAPIITPAYPAMNSTLSVSRQTLQILHEEFCRGHNILDRLWKQHQQSPLESGITFSELFEPSDFFISYPFYMSICIVGNTESEAQSWTGYVESRLRKLVSDMLGKSLPLSKIQLWPKKFEACVADRTALLTSNQRRNSTSYFVGFQVDRLRMRGNQLNIEQQMQNFREWELNRFQPLLNGMDMLVKTFKVKELPLICFEGIYEGGKLEGMQKRRRIRDADPKRQEAKRLAKLNALKQKMAEIQKKKEKAQLAERKRKREDGDDGDEDENDESKQTKSETNNNETKNEDQTTAMKQPSTNDAETNDEFDAEEEFLLENALDNIQTEAGESGKTREEAELDRKKLLAGELLIEGAGGAEEEDDGGDYYGTDDGKQWTAKNTKIKTLAEEEADILRNSGYIIISDDDADVIGGNMILPWRIAKEEDKKPKAEIKFKTEFDIIELDVNGYVVDKGDEDFTPSSKWIGRRPGFEFKLGERGIGYYKTGKKVRVPSNVAYR